MSIFSLVLWSFFLTLFTFNFTIPLWHYMFTLVWSKSWNKFFDNLWIETMAVPNSTNSTFSSPDILFLLSPLKIEIRIGRKSRPPPPPCPVGHWVHPYRSINRVCASHSLVRNVRQDFWDGPSSSLSSLPTLFLSVSAENYLHCPVPGTEVLRGHLNWRFFFSWGGEARLLSPVSCSFGREFPGVAVKGATSQHREEWQQEKKQTSVFIFFDVSHHPSGVPNLGLSETERGRYSGTHTRNLTDRHKTGNILSLRL